MTRECTKSDTKSKMKDTMFEENTSNIDFDFEAGFMNYTLFW